MSNTVQIAYYHSPVGELILGSYLDKLVLCDWRYRKMRSTIDQRIKLGLQADFTLEASTITQQAIQQLQAYFNGQRTEFNVPINFIGTDFQQRVWRTLMNIPFGKTLSYLELSRNMGDDKAIRAVAAANGANAISILVPCHRIIGSDGHLVGYAGGLSAKKKLLELEGAILNTQLDLFD